MKHSGSEQTNVSVGALASVYREQDFSVKHSVTSIAIPLHSHADYVFGYYFRGLSRCRLGSRSDLYFGPGDLGLLNPGSAHEDLATDEERDYVTVDIKKDLFHSLLNGASNLPCFVPPKISNDADFRNIFESIRYEMDHQLFGREAVVRSLVVQLAVQLLRVPTPGRLDFAREEPRATHRREVRLASEYLRENFSQPFRLDEIAAAAGLSKYHLERVFKQSMGINLHTYMVLVRLEYAKQALATTSRPIAEISLELGFSDQSHFTNVFRRFVGVSPHSYRTATQ